MKILVTFFPDLKKMPVQRPHHLLKYLAARHEVTVINTVNAWWWEAKRDPYLEQLFKILKVNYVTTSRVKPIFQELFLVKNLKSISQKYDFNSYDIHLNISSLIAGYFVTRKMRQSGIPTVFDVCDDFPERFLTSQRIPYALRPLAKPAGRFMLGRNLGISENITYVTQSLGDFYHFPPHKSILITNGVDNALFYNRLYQPLSQRSGSDNSFVVGFVGFMNDWIDLEPAFIALKSLSADGLKIRMLVGGDGSQLKFFNTLADKHKIADKVRFSGFVPHEQVPQFIYGTDCCLISLKPTADCHNSFPLTLLEYMACGRPVISTPLKGVKEAVGDRVLYASGTEEIKQCILALYRDSELRTKLGTTGRVFVEQHYTWDRIGQQFEEVIVAAAAKSRKRSPDG